MSHLFGTVVNVQIILFDRIFIHVHILSYGAIKKIKTLFCSAVYSVHKGSKSIYKILGRYLENILLNKKY